MDTYILTKEHRLERDKIKGSRFLGSTCPVSDEAEAKAFVARIRKEFPGATHHCFAWRILGERYRYSDDGEPGGTAGKPIFAAINGRDLRQTAVVVTRWYGGTKLGAGGLVRAYGGAAAAVLRDAAIEAYVARVLVQIRFGYADQGAVKAVFHGSGLVPDDASYGAEVVHWVTIRADLAEDFAAAIVERTAGRAAVEYEPIN